MLDYAGQRAAEALATAQTAVLATSGPAGVQLGEYPCEATDLDLWLLLPQTSDHLFNLEHDATVTLLAAGWELRGEATVLSAIPPDLHLDILRQPSAEWCVLVRVDAGQIQLRRQGGWGNLETIDLREPDSVIRPQKV